MGAGVAEGVAAGSGKAGETGGVIEAGAGAGVGLAAGDAAGGGVSSAKADVPTSGDSVSSPAMRSATAPEVRARIKNKSPEVIVPVGLRLSDRMPITYALGNLASDWG